jgi:hypothetical protein
LTFVLSEIELITNDGISILKTGQSLHTYEQGHIVTFIEDTTLLSFTPKMKGLEIEFKK